MWLGQNAKGDKVLSADAVDAIVRSTGLAGAAAKQHEKTSARVLVPAVRQMLTRIGARDLAKQRPDGRLMMGDYNALTDLNSFIAVHIDADQGLVAEFSGKEALARRDRSTLYASDGPALDRLFSALSGSTPPCDLVGRFESNSASHEQASDTQLMALVTPVQVFASFPRVYPRRMGEEPRSVRVVLGCLPDQTLSVADNKSFGPAEPDAAMWRMAAIWYTVLRAMQLERTDAAVLVYTASHVSATSKSQADTQTEQAVQAARALAFVLRTHFAGAFRLVVLCCPNGPGIYEAMREALMVDDSRGAIPVRLGVLEQVDPLALAAELAAVRLESGALLRVALFVPTNWRSLRLGTIGMSWNAPAADGMSLCEFVALGTTLLLAHRDLGGRWWSSTPQKIKNPFATIDLQRPLPFYEPGHTGRPMAPPPDTTADPSRAQPAPAGKRPKAGAQKTGVQARSGRKRPGPGTTPQIPQATATGTDGHKRRSGSAAPEEKRRRQKQEQPPRGEENKGRGRPKKGGVAPQQQPQREGRGEA